MHYHIEHKVIQNMPIIWNNVNWSVIKNKKE